MSLQPPQCPSPPEVIETPDTRLVAELRPSPNVEPRRPDYRADMIVLHYTGMASAAKAIDWLSRPESRVSAHYVVDVDGRITQLVAEAMRAWHAGVSSWHGETDINSLSIGIEIQNPGHEDGYHEFPDVQMRAVAALCRDIGARHDVKPERVLAHSDIAPARKIDPGEKFDWAWLAEEGIGHWVKPVAIQPNDPGLGLGESGERVQLFQRMLACYGYGVATNGLVDPLTVHYVKAFQRHFRPELVSGRIDGSTFETLAKLLAALPPPLTV